METAREALRKALDKLRPDDTVAIIAFDQGVSERLAPTRFGDRDAKTAAQESVINKLEPQGSTDIGKAQKKGYEMLRAMAKKNHNAQNRLVLLTDASNTVGLGEIDHEALRELATNTAKDEDIYTTVIGVGDTFDTSQGRKLSEGPGNMFFFPTDDKEMYRLFANFDTRMVSFATEFRAWLELTGFPEGDATVVAIHGSGLEEGKGSLKAGEVVGKKVIMNVPTLMFADNPEEDPEAGGGAFLIQLKVPVAK